MRRTFGDALKEARKQQRLTLKELGKKTGKSVGYLSDIEQGRRNPPALSLVDRLEEILGIEDSELKRLAKNQRSIAPKAMIQKIKSRPRLSELLMRADTDLTEGEFEELIEVYENLKNRR